MTSGKVQMPYQHGGSCGSQKKKVKGTLIRRTYREGEYLGFADPPSPLSKHLYGILKRKCNKVYGRK